ncbi:hypothetical protein CDD81_1389 [Ophiocordyceps australis]|uniref:Short-chain dehydrogenase n=1 Tax=Ophiocordyceps australis TaxID=1399860 RepID=A0A2C5XFE9_9HYPO|nr:hypothetical protein CDD81_1389 [Ophiocordyceps australis]
MPGMISFMRQSYPGKPTFTEQDIPDLTAKVVVVTGSNTGLGKELAQILYAKNAKVYMMARSESKTRSAMDSIRAAHPTSQGELVYIALDLSDLHKVKQAAQEFLARESHLHYLFNNAGVGYPAAGSKSKQGYELQLGVNCIGTFALTKLLDPALVAAARALPQRASVRVIWMSSSAAEGISPDNFVENLSTIEKRSSMDQYFISKLGTYLYATEYAQRHQQDGIVSIPINPGNLDSELWRTQGAVVSCILRKTLLHPPIYGAYTASFAAFSTKVTMEKTGSFVAPWGKFWDLPKNVLDLTKTPSQGGNGTARKFWDWTDEQIKPYM